MTAPNVSAPTVRGKCPAPDTRSVVGFRPTMPQKCAGTRIEPDRSLPNPTGERHALIAAASPPLDPPEVLLKSCGLFVRPKTGFSHLYGIAISGTFVLPSRIAPAAFRLK